MKKAPTFVYRFDDGEEYRLTAQQVREQLDRQIVAMLSSGEPDLVAAGTRQLKALSSLATDAEILELAYKFGRSRGGQNKTGKKAALTLAIEALCREKPTITAAEMLAEFEADAMGQECALYSLREQGDVTVRFVSVDASVIVYDELNGKKGKTLRTTTLNNKLTDAKNAL